MKLFQRVMAPEGAAGGGGGAGGAAATTNKEGAGAAGGAAGAGAGAGSGAAAGGGQPGDGGAVAGAAGGASEGAGAGAGAAANAGAAGGAAAAAAGAGDGKGADPNDAGAKWGANWREGWAAKDEKKLAWAQRYASPQAMLDAAWSANERIAKGELAKPLPENPTPEQLAEHRKSHGIPEKPEGYWEAVKDLKLEEGDKEIIGPYLPIMHELNLSPAQATKLISFRQAEMERQVDERHQADLALRSTTEEELRSEWGPEYRAHKNNITGFLRANFGEEGMDAIMNARTPNGDPLLGSSGILRALAQLAVATNGGNITITSADGGLVDAKGVDARMAEIEKMMRENNAAYVKNEKVQAEYRQLIRAKEQMKARAA